MIENNKIMTKAQNIYNLDQSTQLQTKPVKQFRRTTINNFIIPKASDLGQLSELDKILQRTLSTDKNNNISLKNGIIKINETKFKKMNTNKSARYNSTKSIPKENKDIS